jgi:hypothetical protein
MYIPTTLEPENQEIGGEPLNGSGFETENPATEFESDEQSAAEVFIQ